MQFLISSSFPLPALASLGAFGSGRRKEEIQVTFLLSFEKRMNLDLDFFLSWFFYFLLQKNQERQLAHAPRG